MEERICKILDEAQRGSATRTVAQERLATKLLATIGTELKAAIPVLQTCLDCVVVVQKNEQAVKAIMSFIGTCCAAASQMQSDAAVDPETGAAAEFTEVHPLALWLMAYAVACSKAANKVRTCFYFGFRLC